MLIINILNSIQAACTWIGLATTAFISSQTFLINFFTSLYNDTQIDYIFKNAKSFKVLLDLSSSAADVLFSLKVMSIASVIFSVALIFFILGRVATIIGISNTYYSRPLSQFANYEVWHVFKGIVYFVGIPIIIGLSALLFNLACSTIGFSENSAHLCFAIQIIGFSIFCAGYFFYGMFTLFIMHEDNTSFKVSFIRSRQLVSGAIWQILRATIILSLRIMLYTLLLFIVSAIFSSLLLAILPGNIVTWVITGGTMLFLQSLLPTLSYIGLYNAYKQLSAQQSNS